jgi:hypothetical protein
MHEGGKNNAIAQKQKAIDFAQSIRAKSRLMRLWGYQMTAFESLHPT